MMESRGKEDRYKLWRMEPGMRVNGMMRLTREMAEDIKSGQMVHSMKDIGKMIKPMGEED